MVKSSEVEGLRTNNRLKTDMEINEFSVALDKIKADRDVNLISELLLVFDDRSVHIPPMQSLQTYIESFEEHLWIPKLIQQTPQMVVNAAEWTEGFYAHILNSQTARTFLRVYYRSLVDAQLRRQIEVVLKQVPRGSFLSKEIKIDLQRKVSEVIET
jgi:hypothetical protein